MESRGGMGITDRRKRAAAAFAGQSGAHLSPYVVKPATAALAGQSGAFLTPYVVHAGRTKHRVRRWGKIEFAQAAIAALYPNKLPEYVNPKKLPGDVNALLAKNPDYQSTGFGELSPSTIKRALQTLRRANR